MSMNLAKIEKGMDLILQGIGVDRNDHNFTHTPERYAKALLEMFAPDGIDYATFEEEYSDFILIRGHELYSMCPHHMFPVKLTVSLAYIPNGHVLGISKLARLLDECNDGPLLQEKFTKDVVAHLSRICDGTKGVACIIRGEHGCMRMRGVKSHSDITTYRLAGVFDTDPQLANRFFELTR